MRPMNSSYDRMCASDYEAMCAHCGVDALSEILEGAMIDYDDGTVGDSGWADFGRTLEACSLCLDDAGNGYVVRRIEDTAYGRYLASESQRYAEEDRLAEEQT